MLLSEVPSPFPDFSDTMEKRPSFRPPACFSASIPGKARGLLPMNLYLLNRYVRCAVSSSGVTLT